MPVVTRERTTDAMVGSWRYCGRTAKRNSRPTGVVPLPTDRDTEGPKTSRAPLTSFNGLPTDAGALVRVYPGTVAGVGLRTGGDGDALGVVSGEADGGDGVARLAADAIAGLAAAGNVVAGTAPGGVPGGEVGLAGDGARGEPGGEPHDEARDADHAQ